MQVWKSAISGPKPHWIGKCNCVSDIGQKSHHGIEGIGREWRAYILTKMKNEGGQVCQFDMQVLKYW